MVVRRLFELLLPGTCTSLVVRAAGGVCTEVGPPLVAISELYRECPLEELRRVLRVDSVRVGGGGPPYDRSREELRRDDEGRATLVVS